MDLKDMFADESICIRSIEKEIFVQLVGEERENALGDLLSAIERKTEVQDKKKKNDSYWADQIKNEEAVILNVGVKLREGLLRKVECKDFFFWKSGKVFTFRTDTGEIIGERFITDDDKPQDFTEDINLTGEQVPVEFKQKILALEDKTEKSEAQETEVEVVETIHDDTEAIDVPVDEQNYKTETNSETKEGVGRFV